LNLHVLSLEKDGNSILRRRWYEGFLKRYSDKILRGTGAVSNIKRHTWCTYQNFCDVYDCIYDAMCLAKVAVELEERVMYDIDGNIVDVPDLSTK
jgi:hypothetical protein